MPQPHQDFTARRSEFDCQLPEAARAELLQPKRARILGEPPAREHPVEHPFHRAERILEPQRAKILGRPPAPPQKPPQVDSVRRWWHPAIGWLLALAAVVAVVYAVSRPTPEKRAKALQESAQAGREAEAKAQEALKALRSPTSQAPTMVQPTPASTPASTPSGVVPIPAPRAMLIRLPTPPPRAQLVRLPSPDNAEIAPRNIGQTHTMAMPYGTVVSATLRGFLGNENQLPRAGHIGDMYVVEQTPWIWIQVPGTTAPTWVDP